MKSFPAGRRPFEEADPNTFVQPARMQRLLGRDDDQPLRMYRVSFAAGARTYWHRHDREQLLFGLTGTCVVVSRDGTSVELGPGDLVVVEADEEHWHGAAPDSDGEHLAINLGSATTWLESSA